MFSRNRATRLGAGALVCLGAVALVGCSVGGSADDDGVRKLTMGYYVAENHPMAENGMIPFVEAVEEASDGAIEISTYPDGQLSGASEAVAALNHGILDLNFVVSATVPDDLPLNQAWFLPYGMTGTESMHAQWRALHEDNVLSQELQDNGLVPLMMMVNPAYEVSTKSGVLEDLDSLRGLRLRSPSPSTDGLISAVGANPINVPSTELYESLDRRQLDGTIYNFAGWNEMSLGEQLHHSTDQLNVVTSGLSMVAIDQGTWDELTAEEQEILLTAGMEASISAQAAMEQQNADTRDELIAAGTLETYEWDDAEVEAFQAAMEPVPGAWAESANRNGLPGTEVVDTIQDVWAIVQREGTEKLPADGLDFY